MCLMVKYQGVVFEPHFPRVSRAFVEPSRVNEQNNDVNFKQASPDGT